MASIWIAVSTVKFVHQVKQSSLLERQDMFLLLKATKTCPGALANTIRAAPQVLHERGE